MLNRLPAFLLILLAGALPAHAELEGAGLESGSGLKGGGLKGGGLNGGSLQTGRLEGGKLKSSALEASKLEPAKREAGGKRLSAATLKRKATELTEGGLGATEIRGAVSTIPRSTSTLSEDL